jgi:putative iron-regulated protein
VDTGSRPLREHVPRAAAAEALGRALSGPATLAAFELASERIGIPLSSGMQEHEQSCFSDNTHRDIAADVEGITRVMEGDSTHAGLLTALDAASAQEIRERLARIRKLAHAITPPFDAILSSDEFDPRRRGLQALMGELLGLSGAIQRAGEAAGARVMIGGGG